MDEPQDPNKQGSSVKLEATYQMDPKKRFPVNTVKDILGEVLQHYLAEEKYEAELCKQMTKTISDVSLSTLKIQSSESNPVFIYLLIFSMGDFYCLFIYLFTSLILEIRFLFFQDYIPVLQAVLRRTVFIFQLIFIIQYNETNGT